MIDKRRFLQIVINFSGNNSDELSFNDHGLANNNRPNNISNWKRKINK